MSDRKVTIRAAKDGRNWGNAKERSLGEQGEYRKRVVVARLGQFRQGALRIRVSSPIKAALFGAVARITPASN